MWRTNEERAASAGERLTLAAEVWHWQPHPSQGRLFSCPAPVRVAACGRRWGKTEALGVDVASLALAEARAGRVCRQLVVAPTDAQARLLGDEIAGRLREAFERGGPWTDGLALDVRQRPALQVTVHPEGVDPRTIRNAKRPPDGTRKPGPAYGRVLCRSAARDGAGLRGLWAHRIVVDEAARVPDAVLTEVLLPMLMDVGGEYALASSPAGRRGAFYRLFARGASVGEAAGGGGFFASFQCPTAQNPHNDRAFLESMREEMSDAVYAQEILAEFADEGGAVFREEDIAGCLAADPRVRAARGALLSAPAPGRLYSVGIDWGRRADYTVCAVLDATEAPARLVHLQRWTGTGWDRQLAEVAETVARFAPRRVLADGNSIGDPLAETLAQAVRAAQARLAASDPGLGDPPGVAVERFLFTSDSKLALVDRLTLGLARRGLCYPPHAALLAELRGFEYGATGAGGRARMAARGSGHDDIVMALALAWWGAPAGPPPGPSDLILLGSSRQR